MNFEDLRNVWQEEPARQPDENVKAILATVRRKARAFDRSIIWRDARETVAAVIVAVAFGWTGVAANNEGASPWLCWIAAVIPLGVAAFLLVDRRCVRRLRPKSGETVLEEIDGALAEVRHQVWLLRNVLWWYIIPLAAAALLFLFFVVRQTPLPAAARVIVAAVMLVIIAVVNIVVWRINRHAVRKHLEPRIEELKRLRETLAAPETEETRE